jgi:hypothetical protein
MKARVWRVLDGVLPVTVVAMLTIAATVILTPAEAAPVEYVKICSLYGAGFYYIPGTDTCFNPILHDAREQTAGGTWRYREPPNPHTVVRAANAACRGGRLIKLGDFSSSDLTLDVHNRWITEVLPLKLGKHEYIKSVIYQGGFTGSGVDPGNFCLFYFVNDDPKFGPFFDDALGCINTAPFTDVSGAQVFTPDLPVPPTPPDPADVFSLRGANGRLWKTLSPSDIQGELKVWLCIR